MAFNSKDTAAFKGVWVFCEQRDGVIMGTGYQLLSEGRKLADDLGVELCGVLLGDNDQGGPTPRPWAATALTGCTYCDHPLLKDLHHRRLYQGHLRPGGG